MFPHRCHLLQKVLALLTTLAVALPCSALLWPDEKTLPDLAVEASLAFRGTVEKVTVHSVDIGTELPVLFSSIDVRVERGFIGAEDRDLITVRQIGGERSDGYGFDIAGAPAFYAGEEIVLFSNDVDYPAFAGIRADQGTWRTAWWRGERLLLRADWVPVLMADGGDVPALARCMVEEAAKETCLRWVDEDGHEVPAPVDSAYEHLLMTVEDFDVLVEDVLPASSPVPVQLYTSDAAYAADLAAYFRELNRTQVPPAENAPTSAVQ